LVVGGMVIMNIMLVSVTERTREIGVRMAIGARRRDITFQVLIESATLSGTGAVIGIGIGLGLAQIVRATSPLPAAIAPSWMIAAVLLGVTVGVVAGVYPARRAAKMDPVEALRREGCSAKREAEGRRAARPRTAPGEQVPVRPVYPRHRRGCGDRHGHERHDRRHPHLSGRAGRGRRTAQL